MRQVFQDCVVFAGRQAPHIYIEIQFNLKKCAACLFPKQYQFFDKLELLIILPWFVKKISRIIAAWSDGCFSSILMRYWLRSSRDIWQLRKLTSAECCSIFHSFFYFQKMLFNCQNLDHNFCRHFRFSSATERIRTRKQKLLLTLLPLQAIWLEITASQQLN